MQCYLLGRGVTSAATRLGSVSFQSIGRNVVNHHSTSTSASPSAADVVEKQKEDEQKGSGCSTGTGSTEGKSKTVRRAKTPIGKLDELEEGKHPFQEKDPLPPWPDNTNPHTGEIGGPRGPEPTRYGDWERKGRVSDF